MLKAEELSGLTFPNVRNKRCALVPSASDPTKSYSTDLDQLECGCGRPAVTGDGCKHLIYHANSIGEPLTTMVHARCTVEGMKLQYPADLKFEIPSGAAILASAEIDLLLRLPLVVRKRPGRPATVRKKSGMGNKRKRKEATCSLCLLPGHTRRTCTNVARGR